MPALMPPPDLTPAAPAKSQAPALLARRRGALVVLGPGMMVLLSWLYARPLAWVPPPEWFHWGQVAVGGLAALYVLGAWSAYLGASQGRWPMTVAALGLGTLSIPALAATPFLTLGLLLASASLLVWLWSPGRPTPDPKAPRHHAESLQGAAIALALIWFASVPSGFARGTLGWAGAFSAAAVASLLTLFWAAALPSHHRKQAIVLGAAGLAAAVLAVLMALLGADLRIAMSLASLPPVVAALLALRLEAAADASDDTSWWESLVDDPARTLVVTFVFLCAFGGLLLALPISATGPHGVPAIDALFTAVSATCVTGLNTLDPGKDFSGLGQVFIVILIQTGGLGIMTFSTAAFSLLGRRLSLRHEASLVELLSADDRSRLQDSLRKVLIVTFATEAAGAALLFPMLLFEGHDVGSAAWEATFTSVSAFCNAGFGLQTLNLVPYQHNELILQVVSALIIVGGMGPAVVWALPDFARRRRTTLHFKLVVSVTAALLVVPAVFIAVSEWSNTLAGMDVIDRLSNAWLQSVTPRTAGFNSVDLTAIRPATVTTLIVLMFIGGSPASTAGGIKTTTLALLLLAVVAALRGRSKVTAFGFTIGQGSIYKATAVATLGLMSVFGGFFALQLTQNLSFESAVFEVVSALGTVGLTIGATPQLDSVGKVVVMICMFMGRVGPLTLFILVARSRGERGDWERPTREVAVG